MLRVRIKENYQNQFWNSGTGFTIAKNDRAGRMANEDDNVIKTALEHGIIEVVPDGDELNIIVDSPPKGLKEVVGKESSAELRERLAETKKKSVMKPVEVNPEQKENKSKKNEAKNVRGEPSDQED